MSVLTAAPQENVLLTQKPLSIMSTSLNHLIVRQQEGEPVKIDFLQVKKAAITLRAINHKLRQQIMRLLEDQQRMTVTEIYVQLRLEQSVASQHLAILRRAGIVETFRDGKYISYSINAERLAQLNKQVLGIIS